MYNITQMPIFPYSEYKSAISWGFQHFPYAFYTFLFSAVLIKIYTIVQTTLTNKVINIISKSTLHIFLLQIFIFNLRKYYSLEIDFFIGVIILILTILSGIVWYMIEAKILDIAKIKGQML